MNRKEVVDKCNEIYAKLDDIVATASGLADDLRSLRNKMESLPSEPDEIDVETKEDES